MYIIAHNPQTRASSKYDVPLLQHVVLTISSSFVFLYEFFFMNI